jgi:hypothetical protein
MHEPTALADEHPLHHLELQAQLDEALNQLPEHYRTTVVLCYLEGKTQSEAARQLGTTPDAINSRLTRARHLLRTALQRRGVVVAGATVSAALTVGSAAGAVSLELQQRTCGAALQFAADTPCPPGVSPAAIHLARGALQSMWSTPLKLLSGLLLVAVILVAAWLPTALGSQDQPAPAAPALVAGPALTVPQLAGGGPAKEQPAKKAKHVILLWMAGGPSQFETFDPKPDNANGGPTKSIDTAIKGVKFSEHLPKLARAAHRLAVIRSLTHKESDHLRASYLMHRGYKHDNQVMYPSLGSVLGRELADDKLTVPRYLVIDPYPLLTKEILGPGFLGPKYGPVLVGAPDSGQGAPQGSAPRVPAADAFPADSKEQAAALRKAILQALDVAEEKKAVRDAYGMNPFGQSCLLARRLIEVGVPVVEVCMGGWDTHAENFKMTAERCGVLDPAFTALLADLEDRKLLDSTLIVWMGEFGRTPVINPQNGRDHWPFSFPVVLAGARIKGGQVLGTTKDDGTGVAERPVKPEELFATIYQAVGVDPAIQYQSNTGKPVRLAPVAARPLADLLK